MDPDELLLEQSDFHFSILFDVNRGGFFDVAEQILSYLDYASFIRFKQTCKMVYQFIKSSNIEQVRALLLNICSGMKWQKSHLGPIFIFIFS